MLHQRIAVVTGTNSGFGRLTVESLVYDGWHVFATMRNVSTRNAEAAAALRTIGADVVELDVTSDASVDAAAAKILTRGVPDLLVNNAGADTSASKKRSRRRLSSGSSQPTSLGRYASTVRFFRRCVNGVPASSCTSRRSPAE